MKIAWSKLSRLLLEDTSTSGTKFSALDGLRGIAVLTVFVSHSSGFDQRLTPWTNFHGTGQIGVYLFFVLSGFLLAHALLQRSEIHFAGFWLRRFFRIAPLYYLIISAVFACQLAAGKVYNDLGIRNLFIAHGWSGFLKHVLFLKGNSVFWTIAAEFEFYFVLPFLVLLLMRFGTKAAAALLFVALAYCGWALGIDTGWISPRHALKVAEISHATQFFDVFLCGILAAWLWRQPGFHEAWQRRASLYSGLARLAAVVLLLGSLICVPDQFFIFEHPWVAMRDWSVVYAIGFSLVILAAMEGDALFLRVLNMPWLRMAGVTGFSWYLVHFPILVSVNRFYGYHEPPVWSALELARWCTSFVITAVVATVLYLAVEKPFMLFSRSFVKRRPAEAIATVPV